MYSVAATGRPDSINSLILGPYSAACSENHRL